MSKRYLYEITDELNYKLQLESVQFDHYSDTCYIKVITGRHIKNICWPEEFDEQGNIKPQTKKVATMNYSTAVFLINKNVRAILTVYEEYTNDAEATRKAVMHKTLDTTIKAGDYVIVPTTNRHKMTVVKVFKVDVDVDFDCDVQVNWIIGKVDTAAYDGVLGQEQQATATIRSAEAQSKREELKKKLLNLNEEQIKALPLYLNGGAAE